MVATNLFKSVAVVVSVLTTLFLFFKLIILLLKKVLETFSKSL